MRMPFNTPYAVFLCVAILTMLFFVTAVLRESEWKRKISPRERSWLMIILAPFAMALGFGFLNGYDHVHQIPWLSFAMTIGAAVLLGMAANRTVVLESNGKCNRDSVRVVMLVVIAMVVMSLRNGADYETTNFKESGYATLVHYEPNEKVLGGYATITDLYGKQWVIEVSPQMEQQWRHLSYPRDNWMRRGADLDFTMLTWEGDNPEQGKLVSHHVT